MIPSLVLIVLLVIQSSYTPFIIGGLVATQVIDIITQDKSSKNIIDDTSITIMINKKLLKYELFSSIRVKVNDGRVLLIGYVNTPEEQIIAEKVAWQYKQVKEVINEIRVRPIDLQSTEDNRADDIITSEIKARLLSKRNIKSANYSVSTINRTVYLTGVAQNRRELRSVIFITKKVKGVKQVVNYVRYRHSLPQRPSKNSAFSSAV